MIVIPLEAAPNQVITLRAGAERYELRLRDIGGMMAVDVTRGDEAIVTGQRAVAGAPLLPYQYLEAGAGNFIFVSTDEADGAIPYWPAFGTQTRLVYATAAELAVIRATT